MFKILQARLQQYMNHEIPYVEAGFNKGRGTKNQISNMCGVIKVTRELQDGEGGGAGIYFFFIVYAKAFDCVDQNKLWKILKEIGMPGHLTCLQEICFSSRSNS